MRISVCIPNYNYERYLEQTLRSVLVQEGVDLEVLVSDNASTDRSVQIVRNIGDPRVKLSQNACNVGFANNLDCAARMATGDFILMLSSDDLVRPGALGRYASLLASLGSQAARTVITASADVIDAEGITTDRIGPQMSLWRGAERMAPPFDRAMRVSARSLLGRVLSTLKTPFNFLATLYPRALWERVGGYRGGRLINPDKWFHMRLLDAAEHAIYLDEPWFAYRWHAQNQTAQQSATGALKYLVDDYATTLELDDALLVRAGTDRQTVARAFVEYDVARHGLATLARGDKAKARRILDFGRAVYPWFVRDNRKAKALEALLALDGIGVHVARAGYALQKRRAAEHT